GFRQYDFLIVLRQDEPGWRAQDHLSQLCVRRLPFTAAAAGPSAMAWSVPAAAAGPSAMAWSVAPAIGVPAAAAHVLELLLGVVTEVAVQLPLPGEIWPNCRVGLGNKGCTSCRPGGDDGHRGRQEKECGALLDHVRPPMI